MPPTNEQLEAFLRDESPDAWERLVDALLASPHYGEHWARHWLDLVRFAETNSFERDGLKPNAWKYRDYVIRSFNDDKPYDQFLREQLAGDELDEVTDESIIATGYYRLGIWDDEPADPLQVALRRIRRHHLDDQPGDARAHRRLCPLSRPQDRSDSADRLLRPAGILRRRHAVWRHREREATESASGICRRPKRAASRAELREKEEQIDARNDGHGRSRHRADVGRRSGDRSETPDREQLLDEKLEQHLNVSEWELYRETLERLDAARDEIDELAARRIRRLALAQCEPHPEPTHILRPRQSACAGRRSRAAFSRPLRRRGAGDSAALRKTPAPPAGGACWPSGSRRRETC